MVVVVAAPAAPAAAVVVVVAAPAAPAAAVVVVVNQCKCARFYRRKAVGKSRCKVLLKSL